jgi:serine-type D-Ala-D-Ala endopeptidase (penicillin-binding protein 7)
LSKTGFTREAGKCLVMRFQAAGKNVIVAFLNAKDSTARMVDAENVQRFLNGQPMYVAKPVVKVARKGKTGKAGIMLAKSKGGAKVHKKRRTV